MQGSFWLLETQKSWDWKYFQAQKKYKLLLFSKVILVAGNYQVRFTELLLLWGLIEFLDLQTFNPEIVYDLT